MTLFLGETDFGTNVGSNFCCGLGNFGYDGIKLELLKLLSMTVNLGNDIDLFFTILFVFKTCEGLCEYMAFLIAEI